MDIHSNRDPHTLTTPQSEHRPLNGLHILLILLGAPIWLSLGIVVLSVIFLLYISLWSVIVSLWAVFASLIGCALSCLPAGLVLAFGNDTLIGMAIIAVGIVSAGLSIFMFFGCKAATKGILLFTKKIALWIKNHIIKKEVA